VPVSVAGLSAGAATRAGAGPVRCARRRARAPLPSAAGFTLVEVMIALAVLSIGMALASRLLIESQLGLVRANAELGNPMPRYALALLRWDLEQATAVPPLLPVWRSTPLILTLASGERVAWARSELDDLERVVLEDDGTLKVRHVVLRDVADWQWKPVTTRLIDAEVIWRARDTSQVPLADVPRTWSPPAVERSAWLRVALRSEGAGP
jgi:prepilin-type N-terminal cleavage/methylation domain-containing protein